MRRAVVSCGLLLLAILLQLTLVNGVPLPGGAPPDLVLVVVAALALAGGPLEGMLAGFCAGLALDIAPPATHLLGQEALVFCLVGYACGRLGRGLDTSAWGLIGVVALGSAAGELLYVATGLMFGDPDISLAAARHVLPASLIYDILLSPFVLFVVVRATGMAADGLDGRRGGASPPLPAAALAGASVLAGSAGAVRDSGTGRTGLSARALRGASAASVPAKPPPSRPVNLRLRAGGGQAGSAIRRSAAAGMAAGGALRPSRATRLRASALRGGSPAAVRPAARPRQRSVPLRLGSARRRDGALGSLLPGGFLPSGGQRRASTFGSRAGRSALGKAHTPRFRGSKPGPPGASAPARRHRPVFGHRTVFSRRAGRRIGTKRTGGLR